MKITRYIDESICINHQMTVTLHGQTGNKCSLFVTDHMADESHFEIVKLDEELVISHFNTRICPVSFELDAAGHRCTTFEIKHDPAVLVHRSEIGDLH